MEAMAAVIEESSTELMRLVLIGLIVVVILFVLLKVGRASCGSSGELILSQEMLAGTTES